MAEVGKLIDVGAGKRVSVLASERQAAGEWTLVYAPGAGSNLGDPFGRFLGGTLPQAGVSLVRFQFPYSEAGRSAPDQPPVLEATWRAVIEAVRPASGKLAIGGRSMGGRIASQVVGAGTPVDYLVLFAYPLHPPGKPELARTAHLKSIAAPALFCSGTRDAFGSPNELTAAAALVPSSTLRFLEGADHGFNVLKSSGRTRGDIWQEAADSLKEGLGIPAANE